MGVSKRSIPFHDCKCLIVIRSHDHYMYYMYEWNSFCYRNDNAIRIRSRALKQTVTFECPLYNLFFVTVSSLCSLQDKGCQIVKGKKKKKPKIFKNRTKPLFFLDFSTPLEPKPRAVCRDPGSGLVDFLLGSVPNPSQRGVLEDHPPDPQDRGQTIKTSLWLTLTQASSHIWTRLTSMCRNTEGFF